VAEAGATVTRSHLVVKVSSLSVSWLATIRAVVPKTVTSASRQEDLELLADLTMPVKELAKAL